jgi:alpha-L-rhamnosidase
MLTKLRVNDVKNPIGFKIDDYVKISWLVKDVQGKKQIAAQVKISLDSTFDDSLFDTGKNNQILDNFYYVELNFAPRTRYYYQVTIWTDKGEEETEYAFFETGKRDEPWLADWIAPPKSIATEPRFRKKFFVKKSVVSARLYVTGLGIYEAYLNGKRISDEYLAPGFHSYDFWLQYQTYEIDLSEGEQVLDFYLGSGWYKGRLGFDGGYTNLYGDKCQMIAELHVTYENGESEIILTDDSWEVTEGPVLECSIYDGEIYDSRKETSTDWKPVEMAPDLTERLSERLSLPVMAMEVLKPKILNTPKGEKVLDFGQNMTGLIAFNADFPEGTKVSYTVGEILQHDNFYNENLRTAKAEFTYISDGKKRYVRPHFTFYGFRYALLRGFPDNVSADNFEGLVLYSELEQTGIIETSNAEVNQLFSNILWGQKGNFLDLPTDCPQRDERLGWTADAQIFARTASYNMFTPAFYRKYLQDLHLEQKALNGSVPYMVPMLKPENDAGFVTGHGAAAWSDAATILPWIMYEHYGDKARLEENYSGMKAWVNYVIKEDIQSGSSYLWKTNFQFGDWLALDGKNPHSPLGGTDSVLVASVYYYYSTIILVKAARVLGYQEDINEYEELSGKIKEAIQAEYFTQNGRLAITTQTAHILVLYFDLVPERFIDRTVKSLKLLMLEDRGYLKTGFVGTPYFAETLSRYGLNEFAYTLLLNEDNPSWLYAVRMGATTIWERWDSVLEDGSMNPQSMNSLNHYVNGSIAEWIYRFAAGIQSDEERVGFKNFNLVPHPSSQLPMVSASYNSPKGLICSRSEILADGRLKFNFTVPFNTTAHVVLPDVNEIEVFGTTNVPILKNGKAEFVLTCGEYEFSYRPSRSYLAKTSIDESFEELISKAASRTIIEKHIPELKGNDLALGYKEMPFSQFAVLPGVSNFVSKDALETIEKELSAL